MSTSQRLTLIGLYNYENQFGRDLFDKLTLPAGYDKTTFVNTLLLEHGEKCVLYTNPDFLRAAIGIWSGKWELELGRIYEALTAEYNPIYNYDRYEESADGRNKQFDSSTKIGTKSDRTEKTEAQHKAIDRPDYEVKNKTDIAAITEHEISADNSSSYSPDWKETTNNGDSTQSFEGSSQNLTERNKSENLGSEQSKSDSKTVDNEQEKNTHKAHLYGNIGVTTSAAMVSEAVKQRMELNLYDIVTGLFAKELLLYIY